MGSAKLSELTEAKDESATTKTDSQQKRAKRKGMRLGVTRGGARRGTLAAKREVDE